MRHKLSLPETMDWETLPLIFPMRSWVRAFGAAADFCGTVFQPDGHINPYSLWHPFAIYGAERRDRPNVLQDPKKLAILQQLYDPNNSIDEICPTFRIFRTTLYRHMTPGTSRSDA